MKSPVKPKLMKILLDGKLHTGIDLATGVGFTKAATIRKPIDSFERAGFITRKQDDTSSGWTCRLNLSREAVLKIYNHPEFVRLRPLIREQPWFCPTFTGRFNALPEPLPVMICQMAAQSHTFFEIICQYDSIEKIRVTYEPVLALNHLSGIDDPVLNDQYLFYQIYVHAVIRDIDHGGLGRNFTGILEESRQALAGVLTNSGGKAKRHARVPSPQGRNA